MTFLQSDFLGYFMIIIPFIKSHATVGAVREPPLRPSAQINIAIVAILFKIGIMLGFVDGGPNLQIIIIKKRDGKFPASLPLMN
jgi:hypothetical protein